MAVAAAGVHAPVMAGWLISVVDDDDSFRESILGYIRSAGFSVQGFASAEAFLASGAVASTDCLTLDVRMNGMSGPALQTELRSLRPQLPIIFITAHGDDRTRARVLREGAVACLPKPFDGEELLTAISTALGDRDD
jgi:FixJ family two-component response regulator